MIDQKNIPLGTAPKAASVAAAGTLVSGWLDASLYRKVHAVVGIDAGAGTPTLTWEQATDTAGAGAKALSAFSGGTFANNRIEVTNDPEVLDVANKFKAVRATVTIAGGAGTLTSLNLHGLEPRITP
jgi:hypothetical protein